MRPIIRETRLEIKRDFVCSSNKLVLVLLRRILDLTFFPEYPKIDKQFLRYIFKKYIGLDFLLKNYFFFFEKERS